MVGRFLMSEVLLYDMVGVEYDLLATSEIVQAKMSLQGYLAHKKTPSPRTLHQTYA